MSFLPRVFKSIQRGTITLNGVVSNTATITSVNTSYSIVRHLGFNTTQGSYKPFAALTDLVLTNATTITASKVSSNGQSIVSYEVLEFNRAFIRSVQAGQIIIANTTTSNTATLGTTLTNVNNAQLFYGGSIYDTSDASGDLDYIFAYLSLTNTTTVTATRIGNVNGLGVRFSVVEFL